jgi:hypothetical protein
MECGCSRRRTVERIICHEIIDRTAEAAAPTDTATALPASTAGAIATGADVAVVGGGAVAAPADNDDDDDDDEDDDEDEDEDDMKLDRSSVRVLCKWRGLDYADCCWEVPSELLPRTTAAGVDSFWTAFDRYEWVTCAVGCVHMRCIRLWLRL